MMICIGPFCIPVWLIIPTVLGFFWKIYEWLSLRVRGAPSGGDEGAQKRVAASSVASATGDLRPCQTAAELNDLVQKRRYAGLPVVVMFTSPSCGPCKAIKPMLDKAAREPRFSSVQFALVDITTPHGESFSVEAGVAALPKIVFYNKGEAASTVQGANKGPIETLLSDVAAAAPPTDTNDRDAEDSSSAEDVGELGADGMPIKGGKTATPAKQ